jgi:hypothetical protein
MNGEGTHWIEAVRDASGDQECCKKAPRKTKRP